MSEYLEFRYVGPSASGKTLVWAVMSKSIGLRLGRIKWHGPWRCYVFVPEPDTIFNYGCLSEIAGVCDRETRAFRKAVAVRGQRTMRAAASIEGPS